MAPDWQLSMASVDGLLKRRGIPSVPKVAVLGQGSGVFGVGDICQLPRRFSGGWGIRLVVALLWREWWPEPRSINNRRGMPRLSADTDTDVEWLKECHAEDVGKLSLEAGGTTHQHYHVHHFSCRCSYGARENAKANGEPDHRPPERHTLHDTRKQALAVQALRRLQSTQGIPPVPKVTVPGQHSGASGVVTYVPDTHYGWFETLMNVS
ncbi:hypothetical protein BC835DRAFT_1423269 [Cytidiella melzeri]|nr:hypothetical protein BC835DRAFT_1423269 [Cytidiella melzeri]